jgi:HK97 gp10 family phage protein
MRFQLDLDGEDTLRRRLLRMDHTLRGTTLLEAAKAGGILVRNRARELAPRASGELATRGIILATTVRKRTYVEVGVGHHRDYFYGVFQELGVAAHTRKAGKRVYGTNYTRRRGGDTRPSYTHPGHKAQPHLRPAFDEETENAIQAALLELRHAITRSTAT